MNKNFEQFIQRMDGNIGYKSVILPLLPRGEVNILDFGGGSGILSHQMKISNPKAHITILDQNPKMLEIAKENKAANMYITNIEEVPYQVYDAIVFCSVLHEIPTWKNVIKNVYPFLKPGGKVIIRDGYKVEGYYPEFKIRLKNPEEAKRFYEECGRDSVIGRMSLKFVNDLLLGDENDVKSFLQTYTWGFESLPREKNENHLFACRQELRDGFLDGRDYFDVKTYKYIPICQQDYFKYLNKLVEVEEMWNTHFVAEIKKRLK